MHGTLLLDWLLLALAEDVALGVAGIPCPVSYTALKSPRNPCGFQPVDGSVSIFQGRNRLFFTFHGSGQGMEELNPPE